MARLSFWTMTLQKLQSAWSSALIEIIDLQ